MAPPYKKHDFELDDPEHEEIPESRDHVEQVGKLKRLVDLEGI